MLAARPVIWRRLRGSNRFSRAAAPALALGAGWRDTSRDMLLSGCSWGMLRLANGMVFSALGADAPVFLVSAILVLGLFAGSLTGLGGAGATEATLIGFYRWSGIDGSIALAAPVLHRSALYLFILIVGGTCLALTPVRSGEEPTEHEVSDLL